jgi:Nucleotidyltransferase of unknown function (DUF6036)
MRSTGLGPAVLLVLAGCSLQPDPKSVASKHLDAMLHGRSEEAYGYLSEKDRAYKTLALGQLAGLHSTLHRKHKVHLQQVTVLGTYPEDYATRLIEMFPGALGSLRLLALDPHDLALMKLDRNSPRDREDVFHLATSVPLDTAVLTRRYEDGMRPSLGNPDREDLTLGLWIAAIEEQRSKKGS